MTLGYKKWFSILGLLAAIIISLFIGLTFDLSILEGLDSMVPGEEEVITVEEEVTPTEEEVTPTEEEVTPTEQEDVLLEEPDMAPTLEKKRGESVYNNIMNTPAEAFSLIRNY
jgi:hypothetical protein